MGWLGNIGSAVGNLGSNLFGMGNQFGGVNSGTMGNWGAGNTAANTAFNAMGPAAQQQFGTAYQPSMGGVAGAAAGGGARSGMSMGNWGNAIQGLAGLGTAYANWQGVQMAGEQNDWLRKFSEGQRDTQLTLTAADQSDRQRTRAMSSGVYKTEEQIQAEVDEYMNEHGVA